MTQKFKTPDINSVLTIGGLIAGAYILYKFSQAAGYVSNKLSAAEQAVIDGFNVAHQSVSTVVSDVGTMVSPSSYFPPVDKRKTNPVGVNVSSSTSTAPDPYYSSGSVYDSTTYDPMGNVTGP